MLQTPSLDIIIVNWNTGHRLRACLESIMKADRSPVALGRVVVVDNASSDTSMDHLPLIDPALVLIRNSVNRGFGAACNQGAKDSEADYLLFLNPDTCLCRDSLRNPIRFMERPGNDSVGICGIRLVDEVGNPTISCARFPTLGIFAGEISGLSRLAPGIFPTHLLAPSECEHSREVDQVIGAFFLVRRQLFELNRGFDERFFVYFEEVDFSLRARQKGYLSYYLADTLAYHSGGGSSGRIRDRRLFYSLRSRVQYGFKNFSFAEAVSLLILTLTVELVARIAGAACLISQSTVGETLRAYRYLIVQLLGRDWKWRS